MAHLASKGVQSLIHYPVPMLRQAPLANVRIDPRGLAATEAHAQTCISIPCHPQLEDVDVTRIVEAVNAWPS